MQDWEPLSSNKRQANSAVEVFRIMEEVCVLDKLYSLELNIWFNSLLPGRDTILNVLCLCRLSNSFLVQTFPWIPSTYGFYWLEFREVLKLMYSMWLVNKVCMNCISSFIFMFALKVAFTSSAFIRTYKTKLGHACFPFFFFISLLFVLVEKTVLYPSKPILTRYSESTNHFIKRKCIEQRVIEEKVTIKLKSLTVPKLCVKLNTLWVRPL